MTRSSTASPGSPRPRPSRERARSSPSTSRSATASPPAPAATPGERWADRLAAACAARNPSLGYRNLAVDGATSADVLEQLAEAIELEPDLVTVVCGANDVLLSTRPDLDALRAQPRGDLRPAARRDARRADRHRDLARSAGTSWSWARAPAARVERGIRALNERDPRRSPRAYGGPCLDVAGHPGLCEAENFTADGLHPSPLGHGARRAGSRELLRDALHGFRSRSKEARR